LWWSRKRGAGERPEWSRKAPGGGGLLKSLESVLQNARGDLSATRVLVTAGPTQEPIDPVRYLGNRSSGKMGFAIARAAAERVRR